MCSVNDYDCQLDDNPPIISKPVNLQDTKCRKCEEKETDIVLRGKDAYCKSCFLVSATHKFRATLGKSKIVRPNDKILVAHSGRAGSSVLLHLIRSGMQESVHKRLIFKSTVLYIDEGALEDESSINRKETVERISQQIQNFGFTGFATSINESLSEYEPKVCPIDSFVINEDKEIKWTFAALPEQSAKEDLLLKLRHRLLIRAARSLNCNKIFTAESATCLSESILSNVSMGRGAHLSLDVGFADTRFADIMILRPIRGFANLEIDHYIRFHSIQVPRPEKSRNSNSIQRLINEFVTEMESESHGTVSTVLRTGEKLTMISDQKFEKLCALCNAALDTQVTSEICTILATDYSRLVSTSIIEPNLGKYELSFKVESSENLEKIVQNDEKSEVNDEKNEKLDSSCKNIETNGTKTESNDEKSDSGTETEEIEKSCNRDCKCSKNNAEQELNDKDNLIQNLCYGCRLIILKFKDEKAIPSFMINSAKSAVSFQKMHEEIADFLL